MTWLAYFIAGISTAGFVTIWFVTSGKEMARARRSVEGAMQQLQLQEDTYPQVRDGPHEKAAANSRETARMIYRETAKNYERTRRKPMNRLPALLLGYRPIPERGQTPFK